MPRVTRSASKHLRRLSLHALTATVICAAAAAYGSGDGLNIWGKPPATATVGQAYSFTPTAADPSGRRVWFAIVNKPAWATFNTQTGHLSGTPAAANVGTKSDITITVSDGIDTAKLPAFSISVITATGSVDRPVISGTPPTSVSMGSTYKFQPTAKDPDGKALSFSVQHKPAWATFSIATGLLDGTPTSAQVGAYDDIIISASNGQYSSALPAFNVTVTSAQSTGNATISWVPPTENTNGSPLTDLAGIRIYYGNSPSSLTRMVQVASAGETSYTIANLAAGTWYFGGVAYTTTGVQSAMSSVVSALIP
jgi:hypothetical protein